MIYPNKLNRLRYQIFGSIKCIKCTWNSVTKKCIQNERPNDEKDNTNQILVPIS